MTMIANWSNHDNTACVTIRPRIIPNGLDSLLHFQTNTVGRSTKLIILNIRQITKVTLMPCYEHPCMEILQTSWGQAVESLKRSKLRPQYTCRVPMTHIKYNSLLQHPTSTCTCMISFDAKKRSQLTALSNSAGCRKHSIFIDTGTRPVTQ